MGVPGIIQIYKNGSPVINAVFSSHTEDEIVDTINLQLAVNDQIQFINVDPNGQMKIPDSNSTTTSDLTTTAFISIIKLS